MTGLALNRLLELRIKDVAARPPEMSKDERRVRVLRGLGLDPMPPRTDLNVFRCEEREEGSHRFIGMYFESRPGLSVSAHLYLPLGDGPFPTVVRTTDDWDGKKSDPVTQASALGLVHSGFAVLVVDAPGGEVRLWNERESLGDENDPRLVVAAPSFGVYIWDLIRAVDLLSGLPEVDGGRIGTTGAGFGALAAQTLFALDSRVKACAAVAGFASKEEQPRERRMAEVIVGLGSLGDRSELLSLRSEEGAVLVVAAEEDSEFTLTAAKKRDDRLRKAFGTTRYRFESFPFGHDYNRRMREAVLAFLREHLLGEPRRSYAPEPIPLTDGHLNPAMANTRDMLDPTLLTGAPASSVTFATLAADALANRYPEPYEPLNRLVAWNRFGSLPKFAPSGIVAIHDEGIEAKEPDSHPITITEVDPVLLADLGLSLAEVHAQILHLSLAGAPNNWEERALVGDALTSLVASMRTLIGDAPTGPPPGLLIAEGPLSSLVAHFLKKYRPDLTVQASHAFTNWDDVFALDLPVLYQPGARYLEF